MTGATNDWKARYRAQNAYRDMGIAAAAEGKTATDCPFDRAVNHDGWSFWIWGCTSLYYYQLADAKR